ncbi:hypothetical protein HYH02_003140 [Chlamydomonas schloesseri]|uniref:BTB domain-containing protein n=1 Tax=Chlamydomonas schloesseri TaxID=2026947 RepID=A0A836B9U3_9CHLO|nr:hypothetical protein HYH02_003140 [Chlamydomonas schloesseri]|eukprot:KAG2452106.1 hypothetical protein HYH02_003140 [Chlamydomonas schloesseri]
MGVGPEELLAGVDAILVPSGYLWPRSDYWIDKLDEKAEEAGALVTEEMIALANILVTLQFSDVPPKGLQQPQKQLTVDRAVLWHASRVLRNVFEDTAAGRDGSTVSSSHGGCSSPAAAVLRLSGDRPEDWEVALRLLQASGEVLSLITWDNVTQLCRLADKYDIPRLRSDCLWFLSANASKLSLHEPLTSPQNLLHAASLAERYLSQVSRGAEPISNSRLDAVIGNLAPSGGARIEYTHCLWNAQDPSSSLQLLKLARCDQYAAVIAPGVQARIQAGVLDALASAIRVCTAAN